MPSTNFQPGSDGFGFVNSFTFTDAERAEFLAKVAPTVDDTLRVLGPFGLAARIAGVRDGLGRLALSAIPSQYGLCGGMAFAALDYFRAGRPVPHGADPRDQPPPGSELRLYLWQRLLESWRLNGVTFLEWKARLHLLPRAWPFDSGPRALRDRSRSAWKTLRERVDAGEPMPLGLSGSSRIPFWTTRCSRMDTSQPTTSAGRSSSTTVTAPALGSSSRSICGAMRSKPPSRADGAAMGSAASFVRPTNLGSRLRLKSPRLRSISA